MMRRIASPRSGPARAAAALAALGLALATAPAHAAAAAHFAVTDAAIAPGFGPFTATVEGFGAGARLVWAGSGFEPAVVRTRWTATEDAPDRIVASPDEVAHWDTLRTGALDGARVDVYRIADGRLDRVRSDRIAAGGHQAGGWRSALPDGVLVAPGETTADYAFATWNRPGADYWFAVQAVGADGAVSAPSEAAPVTSPAEIAERQGAAALVAAPEGLPRPEEAAAPGGPPAPRGLTARLTETGVVRLEWTADAAPPAGWRVLISDEPPEAHRGFFAVLEGGADAEPIRAGDLAILSRTFETPSRAATHTNRVWNALGEVGLTHQPLLDFAPGEDARRTWRLVRHEPGTPVEEPGETYLELALDRGASARVGRYNHGGPGQHWYEVLEPGRTYRVEFWLKADRPTQVRVLLDGPYGRPGPLHVRPQTVLATPDWRKATVRFTPPAPLGGDEVGWMGLEVDGPATVGVDNLRIHPDDAPWLELDAVDAARLAASGVEALRTHGLIKTFRRTYDLGQLTNPGGVTGIELMNTLPQSLRVMERAGVDPWLQIEPHLAPEEWLGLVEYLAAPAPDAADAAARPWAAKRAGQGRAAPWTDAFDRIYLEVGNETWNGLFAPWTFPAMPDAATGETLGPGTVYGLFQEHVIRTLRASPWWAAAGLDDKVTFVLGGWGGTGYGAAAAAASPASDLLTIAAYNGGWDAGEGPPRATPRGFFEVLNDVSQAAVPDADRLAAEAAGIGAARGRPLGLGTYEAGPGYALDGLNGDRVSEEQAAEQERVMKSVAAGTATLDAFLARAARGFTVQNFFTFGEGRYWRSHARRVDGGAAHPAWDLLALYARVGRGEMLKVETLEAPRADIPATSWRGAVDDAPQVAAYAARAGDRLTLTVVSRRVPGWPGPGDDGATAVTVDLPFARAARVTRHRVTGAHDAANLDGPTVGVVAEPAPEGWVSQGRLEIPALPPGHAEIYVFEGIADG